MTTRILRTKADLRAFVTFLEGRKLPLSVTVQMGKLRSVEQNRLQRLWLNEIAEQLGDQTPEDVRGFCKLCGGVPILRAENETFREKYDRFIRPLPYEQKLAIMQEPLDLPVTRIMNTSQKTRYLDWMMRHFSEQGIILTAPDEELV